MTVLLGCIIIVSPPRSCSVKLGMSQMARGQGFGALPRPFTNTQIIVRAISLCGAASTDGFGVVSGRLTRNPMCGAFFSEENRLERLRPQVLTFVHVFPRGL